jgi:inosine-uridine nucleoside N-ribohydrolase
MIPMIIDTDPGVDDAMAIAYALSHPDIELLALTTVFGNTHLEATTRNACWLLDQFGAASVDVARGAALPMAQGPLPHAEFVHGADGVGNAYPSEPVVLNPSARHARIQESSAAEYIVAAARARPGEIALVAIGPLTNIAAALALEPSLPSLVHSLVIMGGTLDEPGNVSPAAEANFFNDPHAGDSILAVEWPATLVGLDVTHNIMIADSDLDRIGNAGTRSGQLIREISRFYVDFYTTRGAARALGTEPCCAMHDAAAVACVVMPDAFDYVTGPARVVPDGMASGQLLLDRKGYAYATPWWEDRPATVVCTAVDSERVRTDFVTRLVSGEILA